MGEPPRLDEFDVHSRRLLRDGGTRTYFLENGGQLHLPAARIRRDFDDGPPGEEEMVEEQTTSSGEVLRRRLKWPTFQRPGDESIHKLYRAGNVARRQVPNLTVPSPPRETPLPKPPGACTLVLD